MFGHITSCPTNPVFHPAVSALAFPKCFFISVFFHFAASVKFSNCDILPNVHVEMLNGSISASDVSIKHFCPFSQIIATVAQVALLLGFLFLASELKRPAEFHNFSNHTVMELFHALQLNLFLFGRPGAFVFTSCEFGRPVSP